MGLITPFDHVSSSLLRGCDEREILFFSIKLLCQTRADTGQSICGVLAVADAMIYVMDYAVVLGCGVFLY